MHRFIVSLSTLCLIGFVVISCGEAESGAASDEVTADGVEMEPEAAELGSASDAAAATDGESESADETETSPQIAYSYEFAYRIPGDHITAVQQAHVALCDELGAARCRIDRLERRSGEGDYSSALLALRVESDLARQFGDRLDAAASEAGGENSNHSIQAEDLSRQIVDTEAHIRAKQVLAARLLAIIENRAGTVGELVEAERAFAQAQQELDTARTWLREMRGRVDMSEIVISYQSYGPNSGFLAPVRDSFSASSRMLGGSLAALISLVILALPWILLITLIIWLVRRSKRANGPIGRLFSKSRAEDEAGELEAG